MVALNVDLNDVEPMETRDFSPIPRDKYVAWIVESEAKPTKAGTGEYVNLKVEVTEGQYKGRILFDSLNLKNPNAQTVEIATRRLKAIANAAGVFDLRDTSQLHYKPMLVSVVIKKRSDNGELKNEINGYDPLPGAAVLRPAMAQAVQKQAPVAGGDNPPWKR